MASWFDAHKGRSDIGLVPIQIVRLFMPFRPVEPKKLGPELSGYCQFSEPQRNSNSIRNAIGRRRNRSVQRLNKLNFSPDASLIEALPGLEEAPRDYRHC